MTTPSQQFPKYSREENRNCKLSDKDIADIQERRENGETYKYIAEAYNITPQAVFYWCLDPMVREEKLKDQAKNRPYKYDPEYYKQYRKRKMSLHPEYVDYYTASNRRAYVKRKMSLQEEC